MGMYNRTLLWQLKHVVLYTNFRHGREVSTKLKTLNEFG